MRVSDADEVIREFVVESVEGLDLVDRELLALEKSPGSQATVGAIFRAVHTIKGTAGCLGFSAIEDVAHAGESLLGHVRDGSALATKEVASGLLHMVDTLRALVGHVAEHAGEGELDVLPIVQELVRLDRRVTATPSTGRHSAAEPAPSSFGSALASSLTHSVPPSIGTALAPVAPSTPSPPRATLPPAEGDVSAAVAETSIRVDVRVLDSLMNLVGELVLARNQILQLAARAPDPPLSHVSQRLNQITTDLQERVMETRLQPIGHLWNKVPRVVRDLAVQSGKDVEVAMEGKDTELDRTLIEALRDPFTHLVRNAVDHGIELPEERVRANKPACGRLRLVAYHEGGNVHIEMSDDGKGLDAERIKEKAIEKGLVGEDAARAMSEAEVSELIFLPGFSTAEAITNVSGRGVGMDVVRTNIERIGGTLDIQSRRGVGTTFKVRLPLTLAIVPALMVRSGGIRYAIPQVNLLELVRIEGDRVKTAIERLHGTPVYRLREALLPLVHLAAELDGTASLEDDAVHIVVLETGDRPFWLVVDAILDTEEIVVKPLGKLLSTLGVYSGATILGDGEVALILDAPGLARRARVLGEGRSQAAAELDREAEASTRELHSLLLVATEHDGRLALPLADVARLEEVPRAALERVGDELAVQCRDEILPLVMVSGVLEERRRVPRVLEGQAQGDDEKLYVVVHDTGAERIGLVVDRIVDIVEDPLSVRGTQTRAGTTGTAVIQGRVTELLDARALIALARRPRAGDARAAAPKGADA